MTAKDAASKSAAAAAAAAAAGPTPQEMDRLLMQSFLQAAKTSLKQDAKSGGLKVWLSQRNRGQ